MPKRSRMTETCSSISSSVTSTSSTVTARFVQRRQLELRGDVDLGGEGEGVVVVEAGHLDVGLAEHAHLVLADDLGVDLGDRRAGRPAPGRRGGRCAGRARGWAPCRDGSRARAPACRAPCRPHRRRGPGPPRAPRSPSGPAWGRVPRWCSSQRQCSLDCGQTGADGHGRRGLLPSLETASGLVGVAGFEPTAPRSQSECATKLRHTPWPPESRGASEAPRQPSEGWRPVGTHGRPVAPSSAGRGRCPTGNAGLKESSMPALRSAPRRGPPLSAGPARARPPPPRRPAPSAPADAFSLFGDPEGSQFEGIAVAPDRETFYVSEVTGGEIHRGEVDEPWTTGLARRGRRARADGMAVGIATDSRAGSTSPAVATGPTGAPARRARLLGLRRQPRPARRPADAGGRRRVPQRRRLGPDGAAYVTDSVATADLPDRPRGRRTGRRRSGPRPSGTAGRRRGQGFGLNGFEVSRDGQLIVAHSTPARCGATTWRRRARRSTPARRPLVADGLVVRGHPGRRPQLPARADLSAIGPDATSAGFVAEVPTAGPGVHHRRRRPRAPAAGGQPVRRDPAVADSEVVALPFRPYRALGRPPATRQLQPGAAPCRR